MRLKRQEMLQKLQKVLAPIPHEVDKNKSFSKVLKTTEIFLIEKNAAGYHLENRIKKVCTKFHEATTTGVV